MNYKELIQKGKEDWERRKALHNDASDDEGKWITTENGHKLHLNAKGEIDKGNPHVVNAIKEKYKEPFAERRTAALNMHKSNEIPVDVLGQLDSHNYSDEILDRAVESKWITKEQANSIRNANGNDKKEKSSSATSGNGVKSFKGKSYKEVVDMLDELPEGTVISGIKSKYYLEQDPNTPDTTIKKVGGYVNNYSKGTKDRRTWWEVGGSKESDIAGLIKRVASGNDKYYVSNEE